MRRSCAIVEAVERAEGPSTVVSDHKGTVGVAQRRRAPRWSPDVWKELYEVAASKDVEYQ
jgi:hypothetical protein